MYAPMFSMFCSLLTCSTGHILNRETLSSHSLLWAATRPVWPPRQPGGRVLPDGAVHHRLVCVPAAVSGQGGAASGALWGPPSCGRPQLRGAYWWDCRGVGAGTNNGTVMNEKVYMCPSDSWQRLGSRCPKVLTRVLTGEAIVCAPLCSCHARVTTRRFQQYHIRQDQWQARHSSRGRQQGRRPSPPAASPGTAPHPAR